MESPCQGEKHPAIQALIEMGAIDPEKLEQLLSIKRRRLKRIAGEIVDHTPGPSATSKQIVWQFKTGEGNANDGQTSARSGPWSARTSSEPLHGGRPSFGRASSPKTMGKIHLLSAPKFRRICRR